MPMEQKCICSRSEAFIPEATPQIEGLSAIMSKKWIEEEGVNEFQTFICTIGDAEPQEVIYHPKAGVEPLSFSRKHLKRIDGQIVEGKGNFSCCVPEDGAGAESLSFSRKPLSFQVCD